MKPQKSNESLKEYVILKLYRDLGSVFSPLNANFLPSNRDGNHAIELKP